MTPRPDREGTVVLLHGTPLTPSVWNSVIDRLGDRVTVAPDCTYVPHQRAQATLAAGIASMIPGDLDVVGHSFGGQTAIELALLIPDRIRSLTILCSRDTPFPTFATAAQDIRDGRVPQVQASLERWFTAAELAQGGAVVDSARQNLAGASAPDWAAALDAIATYDRASNTPRIHAPPTILGAGLDAVSTPAAVTAMAQRIPHATLEIRHDWAHMSPFVHLDELAQLLRGAFARGG